MRTIKQQLRSLEYKYTWLKIINSPFVRLKWKFKWYKKITAGTPYFLPRKSVKFTKKDSKNRYLEQVTKFQNKKLPIPKGLNENSYLKYNKTIPINNFGINYWSLGWKTKWSNIDVRFECNPGLSIVLFGTQIVIYPIPDCNKNIIRYYWEAWLIYHYNTDRTKSVGDRLLKCFELYPAMCIKYEGKEKTTINYYNYILKDKYKYLIDEKI